MPSADATAHAEASAAIAHVLRRTTFGPFPGEVDAHVRGSARPQDVIESVLAATPARLKPPALGSDDDERVLTSWWLDRMTVRGAGLTEKMTWFWHSHFTSGFDKVREARHLWSQHQLLRRHAMGNFRDLVRGITKDAAMLQYLDGAQSTAEAPNENYAREMMELFTLGRQGSTFTESDVRSGARALAGWTVEEGQVRLDPVRAHGRAVRFLGKRVTGADDVVDAVCDHPACAPFIASKLHRYFVGQAPDQQRLEALAGAFRKSDLDIRVLVAEILRHPSFLASRYSRPRQPVEWLSAASPVLGRRPDDLGAVERLGQLPFHPPNVAGWPDPTRWLGAGSAMVRALLARELSDDTEVVDTPDPAAAILAKASIFDPSPPTRTALERAARSLESRRERASVLHALVVCSPEFVLC